MIAPEPKPSRYAGSTVVGRSRSCCQSRLMPAVPCWRTTRTRSRSMTWVRYSSPVSPWARTRPSGIDDDAASRPEQGPVVRADHVGLVGDRVRAREDELESAVARLGQRRLEDDLGPHPREIARDLRHPAVVADRSGRIGRRPGCRRPSVGHPGPTSRTASTGRSCDTWRPACPPGRTRRPCCARLRAQRARRSSPPRSTSRRSARARRSAPSGARHRLRDALLVADRIAVAPAPERGEV